MGVVLGALGQLGYGFAYRVLDAQYFGLAQRRKRVFIVASPGDGTGPAQVLFEPDSVSWDSPPRRETGSDLARSLTGNTGGCSGKEQQMTFVPAVSPAIEGIGILRKALSAFQEMGRPENRQAQPTHKTFGVRRLTPREAERLQGFPDDWTRYADDGRELADGPRYRMCGNAVAVPCSEWIGRRIVEVAAR